MSRGLHMQQNVTIELVTETCYSCGALFGMTAEFHHNRYDDKKSWYCPNGHEQHYVGKTLKEQLAEAKRAIASAEEDARVQAARAATAEREAKRLLTRASAGVCPCCKRSFVQLARHMKSKHPEVPHEK